MKSAAADTEEYQDVILDEAHLADALALSSEAGWNQEADDWRLLFRQATVFGRVRRRDGALVGTSAALPLGSRLSWVCMVLVTAPERRRGHARSLMRRAIEHIAAVGAVAGLDATPAGRDLYLSLGFHDAGSLMRMGTALPSPSRGGVEDGTGHIRLAGADDLPRICDYDARSFGADRAAILRDLTRRRPQSAVLAEEAGRVTGFALARPGRLATQLGPLVADDGETAEQLLRSALSTLSGPVMADVFTTHRSICRLLSDLGFTGQRPFTRMLNGPATMPQDRAVLSAGPELG